MLMIKRVVLVACAVTTVALGMSGCAASTEIDGEVGEIDESDAEIGESDAELTSCGADCDPAPTRAELRSGPQATALSSSRVCLLPVSGNSQVGTEGRIDYFGTLNALPRIQVYKDSAHTGTFSRVIVANADLPNFSLIINGSVTNPYRFNFTPGADYIFCIKNPKANTIPLYVSNWSAVGF